MRRVPRPVVLGMTGDLATDEARSTGRPSRT
jgi:hypothetical protein